MSNNDAIEQMHIRKDVEGHYEFSDEVVELGLAHCGGILEQHLKGYGFSPEDKKEWTKAVNALWERVVKMGETYKEIGSPIY